MADDSTEPVAGAENIPSPEKQEASDLLAGLEQQTTSATAPADTPTLKRSISDASLSWANALSVPTLNLYPLENYTFLKRAKPEKSEDEGKDEDKILTVEEEDKILRDRYKTQGLQRHVSGILIAHVHQHPHLLLSKSATGWHLPGGRLNPGEGETDGLRRILSDELQGKVYGSSGSIRWDVADLLCEWWRPSFAPNIYPYIPAHITKPKECIQLYIIRLPEECTFRTDHQENLTAVPLFNIYNNDDFGPIISSIPQTLSRFKLSYDEAFAAKKLKTTT